MSGLYTNILNLYKTDMKTDGNDTFDFGRDLNENWDKIDSNAKILNEALEALKKGDSLPLFFAHKFDHVLTGDEALGWALQGSLVTMVYPDAVAKVVELYDGGVEAVHRGIDCRRAVDGRYIADISQKDAIDALYLETGVADFYVLDSVNERFYLPRNDWFIQGTSDPNKVNQFNEAGLPNIKGSFNACFSNGGGVADGAFNILENNLPSAAGNLYSASKYALNASRSSAIYGRSNTVQPSSSLKLVYYKVGNTVVNEELIDVGQVLADLQLKADNNAGNFTEAGRSLISSFVMPSNRYIDLTLGSSGASYTAPANGTLWFGTLPCTVVGYQSIKDLENGYITESRNSVVYAGCHISMQVSKGRKYSISYDTQGTRTLRFIYAEGVKND